MSEETATAVWGVRRSDASEAVVSMGKKTTAHPLQEGATEYDVSKSESAEAAQRTAARAAASSGADEELPVRTRHPSQMDRDAVRAEVLTTYTSNQAIVSELTEGADLTEEQKTQMRLNTLDTDNVAKANQSELVRLIEALDADLRGHWAKGEKVKGLRVAIQATKMLNVPKAPHCYPSVFILVAAVLDTFGNFVADRLQDNAAGKSFTVAALLKRGVEADADIIPPETVEICNMWFLKVASIRELLPRICVELSLLKSFRYLPKKMRVNMPVVVSRLGQQIRGVADPLVSTHIRWYLFFRAENVIGNQPNWAAGLEEVAVDAFMILAQLQGPAYDKMLRERGMSHEEYCALFVPALQWMVDTIVKHGIPERRTEFLLRVLRTVGKYDMAAFLLPIVKAFPAAELVSQVGAEPLMNQCLAMRNGANITQLVMVEAFSLMMAEHDRNSLPLTRSERTEILKVLWEAVEERANAEGTELFLRACAALLQYCATHLGVKQINLILGAVRERIAQLPAAEVDSNVLSLLGGLVGRLDPSALLTSAHFLPMLKNLGPRSRRRLTVAMLQRVPQDPVYASATMELAKTLQGVMPDRSEVDERARCSEAICRALRAVFNADAEAELRLLCDARHSLSEIDTVRGTVVQEALKLVHYFGGNPKKRQAAKACLSFCHVTVPAVLRPLLRLRLGILPAAVALQYGFVAQGEALLHLCIQTLKDVTPMTTLPNGDVISNDREIIDTVLELVAISAAVPSHAKYGHLYVTRSVLEWNHTFPWVAGSTGHVAVYTAILRAAARAQNGELCYAFTRCGTNRYHNDPEFVAACESLASDAATAMMSILEHLVVEHKEDSSKHPKIAEIAVDVFETCAHFGEPTGEKDDVVMAAARLAFSVTSASAEGTDITFMRRIRNMADTARSMLGEDQFNYLTKPPRKPKKREEAPPVTTEADDLLAAAEGTAEEQHADPAVAADDLLAEVEGDNKADAKPEDIDDMI